MMEHKKNWFWKQRILVLLLGVGLTGSVLCQEEMESPAAGPAKPVAEEIKAKLAALLPDAREMKSEADGEKEFYGENLYELINGAAGIFHEYAFVALGHAIYKRGDADITVDLYFMGEPLNAFGVFSIESAPDYHYIEMGAQGYLEDGILNFVQGPYYVKLSAYAPEGKTDDLLREFATEVSRRIQSGKALPPILQQLPAANQVPHSAKFSLKAPLGYQFLAPALSAEYAFGDEQTTLVLSLTPTAEEAHNRVRKMREQVAKNGEASGLDGHGEDAFQGKDKYRGEIVGFVLASSDKTNLAVFVVKPPKDREAFLKTVRDAITGKKE